MAGRRDPSELGALQSRQDNIRNMCILAHVDHGKTTLSDSLVSSNGLISSKSVGARFLDSNEEEQKRGITMHASAISLGYTLTPPAGGEGMEYLVNLVDSPGHIDFSCDVRPILSPPPRFVPPSRTPRIPASHTPNAPPRTPTPTLRTTTTTQVSTATRLCDGALIVVDVVEGACTQTHAVVFKALKEGMTPLLVLNKLDRLALELQLSPLEAFYHLRRVVENVNALASTLVKSTVAAAAAAGQHSDPEALERLWNFVPAQGNVIFASAYDCWGFTVQKFANIWAKKLDLPRPMLQKHLFEDYCFNPKTKKLVRYDPMSASGTAAKPMFASMVLEPIWALYETAVQSRDAAKAAKMAARALDVHIQAREISTREPRSSVQAIFRAWLPLADAVLRSVVRLLPSPCTAQASAGRLAGLLPSLLDGPSPVGDGDGDGDGDGETVRYDAFPQATWDIVNRIKRCDPEGPVVVYVSKLVAMNTKELSYRDQKRQRAWLASSSSSSAHADDDGSMVDETSLAVARVFCGTLSEGCRLYVLHSRHDPRTATAEAMTDSGAGAGADADANADEGAGSSAGASGGASGEAWAAPRSSSGASAGAGSGSASGEFDLPTVTVVENTSIYLCLGPSVHAIQCAVAGNIVGIWTPGLGDSVLKTATMSSSLFAPCLQAMTFQAKPMVRVAVEPTSHVHLPRLDEGLRRLHRFDAAVEVSMDTAGQRTMACLGELHLELCVRALRERFARCEVAVSEPLVAFRETLLSKEGVVDDGDAAAASFWQSQVGQCLVPGVGTGTGTANPWAVPSLPPPWGDVVTDSGASAGFVRVVSSNGAAAVTLRVVPLPAAARVALFSESEVRDGEEGGPASPSDAAADRLRAVQLEAAEAAHRAAVCSGDGEGLCALAPRAMEVHSNFVAGLVVGDWAGREAVAGPAGSGSDLATDREGDVWARLVGVSEVGGNVLMLSSHASAVAWADATVPLLMDPSSSVGGDEGSATRFHSGSHSEGGHAGLDSSSSSSSPPPPEVLWTCPLASPSDSSGDVHGTGGSGCPSQGFMPVWGIMQSAVAAAFESVTANAPLMGEALQGVAVVVQRVEVCREQAMALSQLVCHENGADGGSGSTGGSGGRRLHTGQFISEVSCGLRGALLTAGLRVVEPVYACGLQCDAARLGDLYSVLSRRRGQVVNEDIVEGTSLFVMTSYLPVLESFGFAQELLKKTSGAGTTPQLSFSHWSPISEDPFWVPTTDKERDEYGEVGAFNALAKEASWSRALVMRVRRRKGLVLEEKVVASAEKQRTLKR